MAGEQSSGTFVAAPPLRRYQTLGNLLAVVEGQSYRPDRHPTMSRHPVAPVREADLRTHLGQQTQKWIGLIDFLVLKNEMGDDRLGALLGHGSGIVLTDVLDQGTLVEAGRLVTGEPRRPPLRRAPSSELQYALTAYRHAAGAGGTGSGGAASRPGVVALTAVTPNRPGLSAVPRLDRTTRRARASGSRSRAGRTAATTISARSRVKAGRALA